MQSLVTRRLHQEQQLRNFYYSSLEIYKNNSKITLIRNLETLKLIQKIEYAYQQKNKEEIFENIQSFIENKDGIFNQDYGAAKDQLELVLKMNQQKLKITNHELLQHLGFDKQELMSMGISDTKTNSVSKAFEIITLKSLKDKYSFIKDIVYCNDGKTKITCFNATGQPNFDFVVKISDRDNNEHFIAFDHKVKDLKSCIKDIERNGFKYSVFTLGDNLL